MSILVPVFVGLISLAIALWGLVGVKVSRLARSYVPAVYPFMMRSGLFCAGASLVLLILLYALSAFTSAS